MEKEQQAAAWKIKQKGDPRNVPRHRLQILPSHSHCEQRVGAWLEPGLRVHPLER